MTRRIMFTGPIFGIDPDAAVERGIAALRGPDPASALPDIERALASTPADGRLWHLKGLIHREDDRRELALPALERAVALTQHNSLIAHGYARTLFEAGLPSVDAYARAMQLAPGDREIIKGMVGALIAERRIGDAIDGLTQTLSRSPTWGEGHALLSDLRWMDGQRENFAQSFELALALHPRDLALRRMQIITLLHADQYDRVLATIADGRGALGDDAMFIANEAVVRSEQGDLERAESLFAAVEGLHDSTVQVRRVRHFLRSGRAGDASRLIDAWLGGPDAFAFWPYAALAWRLTGDDRSAWLEGNRALVGVYDISERLPALGRLAATLRKLHTTRGQPLAQSVRGGTQTDGNLFHNIDPVIVDLREAIRATVEKHVAAFPTPDRTHPTLGPARSPIRFSGAWSVRLQAGGFHSNHVHPMGWLSSALYVALPPDLGREQAGWLTLGDPRAPSMPLALGPLQSIEPKPGRLVLFPSWMWHGTRPFGEGERLTVAFDVAVPSRQRADFQPPGMQ